MGGDERVLGRLSDPSRGETSCFPGLISVIIPAYNRASLITRTLDSVAAQTYRPIQIVVVDDGSSDETAEVAEKWLSTHAEWSRSGSRVLRQPNSGAPAARNLGLREATGEFIQFLDSDDTLDPQKMGQQVLAIRRDQTPCAICDLAYVDSNGRTIREIANSGNVHQYIASFRSVSIMTPLLTRRSMPDGLMWNERLARNQDMDFFFKYFITITRWSYTPGLWCHYHIHEGTQISDTYGLNIECGELAHSLRMFVNNNLEHVPRENRRWAARYRRMMLTIRAKHFVKRNFPGFIVRSLSKQNAS